LLLPSADVWRDPAEQPSCRLGFTVIQPPPQRGFPTTDAGDKKFNSRLVAPTYLTIGPFGEHVEWLSFLL
jgi:hypothetical protein